MPDPKFKVGDIVTAVPERYEQSFTVLGFYKDKTYIVETVQHIDDHNVKLDGDYIGHLSALRELGDSTKLVASMNQYYLKRVDILEPSLENAKVKN